MLRPLSFVVLLISLNCVLSGQTKWRQLDSVTSVNLTKICFVDSLNGWIGGENGTVLYTSNGGKNWENRGLVTGSRLKDVFFLNGQRGWALFDSTDGINIISLLYSTANGGLNWQLCSQPFINNVLNNVQFVDTLTGFLTDELGTIFITEDGGETWKEAKINEHYLAFFPKKDIKFYNKRIGFVSGGKLDNGGACWVSTDYGNTWTTNAVAAEPINSLCIIDSANVIGIGGDPEGNLNFCITTNGGSFWTYKNLTFFGMGLAIGNRTKSEYWACQNGMDALLCTTDAGQSWNSYTIPDRRTFSDLIFVDSCKGFAVGRNGVIFKYDIDNPVSVRNEGTPVKFYLAQNYPNPFNPSTKISYILDRGGDIKIAVYDILGRKVCTLTDGYCSAGEHSVIFTGEGLPSGNYFYIITGEGFFEAKKMLLLK